MIIKWSKRTGRLTGIKSLRRVSTQEPSGFAAWTNKTTTCQSLHHRDKASTSIIILFSGVVSATTSLLSTKMMKMEAYHESSSKRGLNTVEVYPLPTMTSSTRALTRSASTKATYITDKTTFLNAKTASSASTTAASLNSSGSSTNVANRAKMNQ